MTRIFSYTQPIEADIVDAYCALQKGFTDQFVYYRKDRPVRFMGMGRCIALPALDGIECELEGPVGQQPVFFSFNRFDAENPSPTDELFEAFPRLKFMLPEVILVEDDRGAYLQVNSLSPVYPGRIARFARQAAAAPRRNRRTIPFKLEPDSRDAWRANVEAALDAIGRGRISKVVLSRRQRLEALEPFSSKDLLVNLIDGSARGTVLLYRGRARAVGRRADGRREEPRRARPRGAVHSRGVQPHMLRRRRARPAGHPAAHPRTAPVHARPRAHAGRRRPGNDEGRSASHARRGGYNRGFFAGACGYVDGAGNGEFSVALRTGVFDGEVGWVYAGCGIVEGSVADDEYDEIGMKLKTVLSAFDGGEVPSACQPTERVDAAASRSTRSVAADEDSRTKVSPAGTSCEARHAPAIDPSLGTAETLADVTNDRRHTSDGGAR